MRLQISYDENVPRGDFRLRSVVALGRRLMAAFPKSRQPLLRVWSIAPGEILVTVVGTYTKRGHPYDIDEVIRKAEKGRAFAEHFGCMDVGTWPSQLARDVTYCTRRGQ